jgi:hypothetical protein
MKNNIKYIIIGILTLGMFACQDQTDIYEEFVKSSSNKIYPGKVLNPVSYSGKNRIKLEVLTPGDPSVKEIRVFWNFFTDFISVPVTETNKLMEIFVDNIPESTYSFVIKTYDNQGNVSVPVEVFGNSYGVNYEKLISNRVLISAVPNVDAGTLTLKFGDADISNGAVETWVRYTDASNNEVISILPANESTIVLDNYLSGGEFSTHFLPEATSVDTFSTEWASI